MSADYLGLHGRTPYDADDHARVGPAPSYAPRHYVPEGWEEADRGICPGCGRTVSWDEDGQRWARDETLRVLIVTHDEGETIVDRAKRAGDPGPRIAELVDVQLAVQVPL